MSTSNVSSSSPISDLTRQGVDVSDDAALAQARKEMYAEVIQGLTTELEILRAASESGNHMKFAAAVLNTAVNASDFARNLSTLISVRAMFEYHRAGGELPRTREAAISLSERLFPKGSGEGGVGTVPDPAEIAAQDRAKSSSVDGSPPLSVS